MPIVKVNVCTVVELSVREKIIPEIKTAIVENLGATPEHAYVFLYDALDDAAQLNERLNNNCILVETYMFAGRPDDVKEKYFGALSKIINKHLETEGKAVFFSIIDPEKNNWANGDGVPYSKVL